MAAAQRRLLHLTQIQAWVLESRGWTLDALVALGVGWGNLGLPCRGDRFLLPVADASERLTNLRGYMPGSSRKMVGLAGRPVDLWPCPERLWPTSGDLWLVEGEPDAISARAAWPTLGVTAVPGAGTWKSGWAERLAAWGQVNVLFDADDAGDRLGERVAVDLERAGARVSVLRWPELAGGPVSSGYDVGDWVRDHRSDPMLPSPVTGG